MVPIELTLTLRRWELAQGSGSHATWQEMRFLRTIPATHAAMLICDMCVLNRSFGSKQMVRWGVDTILVRDRTDAMYHRARAPYVGHDAGT